MAWHARGQKVGSGFGPCRRCWAPVSGRSRATGSTGLSSRQALGVGSADDRRDRHRDRRRDRGPRPCPVRVRATAAVQRWGGAGLRPGQSPPRGLRGRRVDHRAPQRPGAGFRPGRHARPTKALLASGIRPGSTTRIPCPGWPPSKRSSNDSSGSAGRAAGASVRSRSRPHQNIWSAPGVRTCRRPLCGR
jgi:hypothetical protein